MKYCNLIGQLQVVCITHTTGTYTHGSGTPGNSLIVTNTLVSECDIVHTALGGSTRGEGFEHHVYDSLAGQYVAPDNSSSVRGIK